ncbi:uncharacterized protein PHACADRAFT_136177 [Phanerochaete carnosa HHB-10118-sp]|uniref:Amine oxidase domain-containing protein n=1 Tax=Phanerochaete carnosa (strain HHB-10118-sp) TaxID=650164 RepID=K5WI28_PHACS|nr:uncharacterized protein PHACADRAFT_136177 [Phanerochaete carnosa HHB-10118-sp]EKM59015.1 hypothetical protein PHACADRAFT_136177 [Phanerochaete carnosa HHB-10118-sp]
MSIARPTIHHTVDGSGFQLELPAEWFANVVAISRRTYSQLVTIEYTMFGGLPETRRLASKWGTVNDTMTDLHSGSHQFTFAPQTDDKTLTFSFYHSVSKDMQNRTRSARIRTVPVNKPLDAPREMPDYMMILVFVEDGTQRHTSGPQYNDLVLTIHTMSTQEVVDTGTAALTVQGQQAMRDFIERYVRPGEDYPQPPPPSVPPPRVANLPVAVIGAGVSGLYIGMMLKSLGIKFEIFEGSSRVGGRLYTHKFPKNQGKYQYYDVGAMRYPNTTFMKRTFDLVRNRLNMPNAFIPYLRRNENTFLSYNNITVTRAEDQTQRKSDPDVFKVSVSKGGNVPDTFIAKGSEQMWDVALDELRQLFVKHPFEEAYQELLKWDNYSVRTYLTQILKYPSDVVNWFESVESRTGLMDESLAETVLASLVFNDPNFKGKDIEWFCLDGGSEIVHRAMTAQLPRENQPLLYHRVTAIEESDDGFTMTVTFDGSDNPDTSARRPPQRKFSNVISTMSFACLRMVDLERAGLSYGQKNAIKDLMYTPSIKVGIQFKTAWWERIGIFGGQSSTDMPIRDAVYPSYGPDESHPIQFPGQSRSNCMIASYNGMQDAQRIGGLMKGRDTPEERVMLNLIMRNLAKLHRKPVEELWAEFEDYYPWDFHRDSFQLGAFCQFAPGQFRYAYPYVTQPASSKQRLHFAGDATSCFHGWVAGALNSAWRAVFGMLIAHPELNPNPKEDIIDKFVKIWGATEEYDNESLETVVNLGRIKPANTARPSRLNIN